MWRADNLILVAIVIGSFFCGIVWAPSLNDFHVKGALEATSYIATIIACVVAVIALLAWKSQFRHAERYATLKDLKGAVTDMHTYRGFLLAVKRSCDHQIANGGAVDPDLRAIEVAKREKMLEAITNYNKAWAAAIGFFTPEEESRIVGTPTKFALLSMEQPRNLVEACARRIRGEPGAEYESVMNTANAEAQHIYALTVSEVERLLREKV